MICGIDFLEWAGSVDILEDWEGEGEEREGEREKMEERYLLKVK